MATYDLIEDALNSPIDWAVFEKLVADILVQDDVPRIRRVGGYKDSGIDAYDATIYEDESKAKTIVQVTSQRAQTLKVKRTLERLQEMNLTPEAIMFVFRHPVASATRAEIRKQCGEVNILCDVRDQSYLMLQLGKNTTGLFSRYFESVKSQFVALLATPDPLGTASDSLRHALLLSVASYIVHPKSRLVRRALFNKTVLAALVTKGSSTTVELIQPIKRLLPEEDISVERVSAALNDLEKSGECESTEGRWCPSNACLAQFGATMNAVRTAYDDLRRSTILQCNRVEQGDQATIGYMERNVRRALLKLLRLLSPIEKLNETPMPMLYDESSMPEIRACLSQDLKDDVARHLVIAFGSYVENKENVASLSLFARSYSALALRNIDPLGRRWQQVALQRSVIALDTDAVLTLLIRELPEHAALRKALDAFAAQGVVITVSPHVVIEATGHISRAQTTFRKFGEQIERFSPAIVDAKVWHAVVRGFYYARKTGYTGDWSTYWNGYYDSTRAEEFVRYQLGKMGKIKIHDMTGIPVEWSEDHELISAQIVAEKECHRCKAEFRNSDEMAARVRLDIKMAMHLSKESESDSRATPHGYLISEDRAFFKAERHARWAPRGRVAMLTRAIPQVAEFACGVSLADDEVVRLLFEPAAVAAAESVGGDIDTLTALGVDLSDVPLSRLEWALEGDLHKALHHFRQDHLAEARLDSAVGIVTLASARGLTVDSLLTELATKYGDAIKVAEKSTARVETTNEMLKRVVLAVATTKKSRRRANRVLKELGLSIADFEKEEESSQ